MISADWASVAHRARAWWTAFNRLHPVLRKAIWLAFFLALFWLDVWFASATGEREVTKWIGFAAGVGVIWASGFWYAFVGAWVVFRRFVRAFR